MAVPAERLGHLHLDTDNFFWAPTEPPFTTKRTTLRGTALHALEVLAPDTARAPLDTAETWQPVAEHRDYYRDRAERYDRLYRAVIAPPDAG